jgi:NACHT domain-containing protein
MSLQTKLDEVRKDLKGLSIGPDIREKLQQLLMVPVGAIAERRILKSLEFSGMFSRFDQVTEAHFKTFGWIFEDTMECHRGSNPVKIPFVDWLVNGSGIFHVSGKIGSGKSTLMKFLYQHERTEQLLNEWAGESRKLILAHFFFWRAGDTDQRNLNGLLRALLYDILEKCPELIALVFQARWARIISQDWRVMSEEPLFKRDIRDAFELLIHNPHLYKNYRFCFFIDGLDEFEETTEDDYKDLLDLLFSWIRTAPEDIKLCVASREYEVFRKAFIECKSFRLQDLTHKDMENVIRGRLDGFEIPDEETSHSNNKEHLISTILERSDGIFLWVTLVLKSLREGLHYDNRLSSLVQKVNDMPRELEPLFQYLLDNINQSDRTTAYRIFAILRKCREVNFLYLSVQYSFLEDYVANTDFAYAIDVRSLLEARDQEGDIWAKKVYSNARSAEAKLNGYCKGLLELRGQPKYEDMYRLTVSEAAEKVNLNEVIEFTHRSVNDFLSKADVQTDILTACNNFDIVDAISHTFLAELKFNALVANKRQAIYRSEIVKIPSWLDDSSPDAIVRLRSGEGIDTAPFRFLECCNRAMNQFPCRTLGTEVEGEYMLYSAARHIRLDYVSWKLSNNSALVRDNVKAAELVHSLFIGTDENIAGLQFIIDIVRDGRLPHRGANSIWRMAPRRTNREYQLWVALIGQALRWLPDCSLTDKRIIGELLEIALTSGVDLHWFVKIGPLERPCIFRFGNPENEYHSSSKERTRQFLKEREVAKIEDLIDFWKLENREKLLALIARQRAEIGASDTIEIEVSKTDDAITRDFPLDSSDMENLNAEDRGHRQNSR